MQGKDVTTEIGTCLISPLKTVPLVENELLRQSDGKMSSAVIIWTIPNLNIWDFWRRRQTKARRISRPSAGYVQDRKLEPRSEWIWRIHSRANETVWSVGTGDRQKEKAGDVLKNKRKTSSGFCWRELVWKGKVQTTALQSRLTLAFPQETREVRAHTLTRRSGL